MKKLFYLVVFIVLFFLSVSRTEASIFSFDNSDYLFNTSPNKVISETVLIKNNSTEPLALNLSWQGFDLNGESSLRETATSQHSIDFATLSRTSLNLQPAGQETVQIVFKLPQNLKSGDYYGSLIAKADAFTTEKANFTIRVLGKIEEKIELINALNDGEKIELTLANSGNVSLPVKTKIKLTNLLGKEILLSTEELKLRANETKTVSIHHEKLTPGYWEEEITLTYGSKDTEQTELETFWVSPWIFILPFAIFFIALSILFLSTWRKNAP